VTAPEKSESYMALEPLFSHGRLELLDHPDCLRELRALERRQLPGGRVRVDHPRGRSDDFANSLAHACWLALTVAEAAPIDPEPSAEELANLRAWQRQVGWEREPPGGWPNLVVHDDYFDYD
jgi:hypothetical protein